jgi:hypothetical protein
LWTPGYWGWVGGHYAWNHGYWGPHVGYYGGVNYGFGFYSTGFVGGEWRGNTFAYNTAVMRVNTTVIHTTYINRTVINTTVVNNHTSFNGPGGVTARPTAQEETWSHEQHTPPTPHQAQQIKVASQDRENFASVNHGVPAHAATPRPATSVAEMKTSAVPARGAAAAHAAPAAHPAAAGRPATPAAKPAAGAAHMANSEAKPAARPEAKPAARPATPETHAAPAEHVQQRQRRVQLPARLLPPVRRRQRVLLPPLVLLHVPLRPLRLRRLVRLPDLKRKRNPNRTPIQGHHRLRRRGQSSPRRRRFFRPRIAAQTTANPLPSYPVRAGIKSPEVFEWLLPTQTRWCFTESPAISPTK